MVKRTSSIKASFERQKRGLKAVITGGVFEKQVGEFLSKQGYTISWDKPVVKGEKEKFDIFGIRYDDLGYEEYCIAECKCKDKSRVTATDVLHFMSKLRKFYKRLPVDVLDERPAVHGLFAYKGELPKDARNAAKGFRPAIKFKEF